jgi:cell wall assembly regulator SMI1
MLRVDRTSSGPKKLTTDEDEHLFFRKQYELYWKDSKATPDARLQPTWWSESWIPYARDIGGNFLLVDLSPGAEGEKGQLILFDNCSGPEYFHSSISSYLTELVLELENGKASWG